MIKGRSKINVILNKETKIILVALLFFGFTSICIAQEEIRRPEQARRQKPTQALLDLVRNETMKNICAYRLSKFGPNVDSLLKDGIYLKPGKNTLAYIDSLIPDYNQKLPLSITYNMDRWRYSYLQGETQFYTLTFNSDSVFHNSKKSTDLYYKKFYREKEYKYYVAYLPKYNRMIYISGEFFYHSKIGKDMDFNTDHQKGLDILGHIYFRMMAYTDEFVNYKLSKETDTEYLYNTSGKIANETTFFRFFINKKNPEIVRIENLTRVLEESLKRAEERDLKDIQKDTEEKK